MWWVLPLRRYVTAILEYGIVAHYLLNQHKLEGIQWRATKLVLSLRDESYIEQLKKLN